MDWSIIFFDIFVGGVKLPKEQGETIRVHHITNDSPFNFLE